ncbi:MAG: hypothetical protein KY393_05360, partial [Actinobacteria bacterium]|nr:hypothetical protein [Actinomycetota bacterium]
MPSSSVYRGRFGSLIRAYGLVGYTPPRDYRYIDINRCLRRMHPEMVADVIANIERLGGVVDRDRNTDLCRYRSRESVSRRASHNGSVARNIGIGTDGFIVECRQQLDRSLCRCRRRRWRG